MGKKDNGTLPESPKQPKIKELEERIKEQEALLEEAEEKRVKARNAAWSDRWRNAARKPNIFVRLLAKLFPSLMDSFMKSYTEKQKDLTEVEKEYKDAQNQKDVQAARLKAAKKALKKQQKAEKRALKKAAKALAKDVYGKGIKAGFPEDDKAPKQGDKAPDAGGKKGDPEKGEKAPEEEKKKDAPIDLPKDGEKKDGPAEEGKDVKAEVKETAPKSPAEALEARIKALQADLAKTEGAVLKKVGEKALDSLVRLKEAGLPEANAPENDPKRAALLTAAADLTGYNMLLDGNSQNVKSEKTLEAHIASKENGPDWFLSSIRNDKLFDKTLNPYVQNGLQDFFSADGEKKLCGDYRKAMIANPKGRLIPADSSMVGKGLYQKHGSKEWLSVPGAPKEEVEKSEKTLANLYGLQRDGKPIKKEAPKLSQDQAQNQPKNPQIDPMKK